MKAMVEHSTKGLSGVSRKELLAELDEHNDFFDYVCDLFPSQVYISSTNSHLAANGVGATVKVPNKLNTKYHKKAAEPAAQKMEKSKKNRHKNNNNKPAQQEKSESTKEPKQSSQAKRKPEFSKLGKTERTAPKSRIEALRAKLKAKIAEKQQGCPEDGEGADQVSKRAARRADKKRRQEEAQKRANKKAKTNLDHHNNNKTQYQVGSIASSAATPAEDLAKVDFGRLTGLKNPKAEADNRAKEVLQNLTKNKNLHKMLHDAEAKHEKLRELKRQGQNDRAAGMQWADTFQEANGTRVKDDPAKIKKQIKKKEAKRQKSQKTWQSRTEQSKASADERLQIRTHNLNARKQRGKVGANLSRKEIRKPEDNQKEGSRKGRGKNKKGAGFSGKKEFLDRKGQRQTQQ
mmetsp:Transcript_21785/g.60559  ORF Transcript_21785/g.60559 Transcript_21785/m.60559 type:complete len:404 (-) Transcript_21785:44-1255(-)